MKIFIDILTPMMVVLTTHVPGFFLQIPQDIPHQSDPVDFTDAGSVWFYIGIPLLMLLLYFFIRRRRRGQNP